MVLGVAEAGSSSEHPYDAAGPSDNVHNAATTLTLAILIVRSLQRERGMLDSARHVST
jgi:hypothetical protein